MISLSKRLHDVFIGAGCNPFLDAGKIVFGGAEHDHRALALFGNTKRAQVLDPAHDRHVPVQQHHIGHAFHTHIQRHLTIFGLGNVEPEFLKYFAGNHSDNFGIVHNKASFHILYPAYCLTRRQAVRPIKPWL